MTTQDGRPQFRTAGWLGQGYAVGDVDDFLDKVFASVAAGRPAPDVMEARFRTARGRGAYDMAEVDDFLDDLVARLGRA